MNVKYFLRHMALITIPNFQLDELCHPKLKELVYSYYMYKFKVRIEYRFVVKLSLKIINV